MEHRTRRTEGARHHRLDFSSQRPADADVVGFAQWLSQVFGSRRQAIATLIRATRLYDRWRRNTEQCPVCNAFVRVEPYGAEHMTTLCDHEQLAGQACRGSGQKVRWDGDRLNLEEMMANANLQQGMVLDPDPITGHL